MAKMTNTSTIKIMLDGSQAENEVQRLRKQLKRVGEELAIVQEKFKGEREWDSGDTAEKLSKRIKELKKTQRSLKSALDAHITQITGVDSVLTDRSAAAYNELTKKRTSLLNLLKRLRLDTEEEMRVYEETSKRLSKVQQEIGERDIDLKSPTTVARAQEVLARPEDYSTKEINEAIAAMTKFRDTKKADSEEWKHWNGYVRNGALFMEEFNQKVKTTNMEELHADLKNAKPTISDKDLNVLVKYWEEMAQGAKVGSTAQADFNKKLAEARDLQTARKREQGEKVVTEVADQGQFGSSLSEMQQRLKLLQDYRTVIDSTKPDAYVRVDAAIEKLTQKIKESQAGFLSYADAMKQAEGLANGTFKGNVSDLEKMKKSLEEYRETLKIDDTANLKKINALLDDIAKKQKELADINKREQSESKIAGVSGNIAGSSPAELEEAIRLAKELQKMNGTSATQYQSLAKFINEAEAQLKKYNDQVKHAAMENQFLRLANLSKNALEEQRKYWQDVFDNAEKGTAKYIQAERKLVDINKTLTDRKSDEAGAIMGNLPGSSVGDIERAIKMTEELMKAHSRGSAEYEIYAEEIKKAKEYLQSYVDMEKQVDMEDKWSRLRTLSTDALAEQKKYWQEMVNGAQQGTQELADYEAKLKGVVEEERMRLDNKATKVLADPTSFSVKEVQDSIKAYEQLRDAQRTGSGNWEYYNKKIEEARETLKHYNDEAKKTTMEGRLGGIATASTASLAEQKKYWQEMVDGAERGTQALKDYQDNLAKVTAEERTRLQNAAQQTITDYNTGNWNKTIGETKEAIKQLQEYRNTLNEKNDSKALADVDKVLTELTQKTKEAEQGYMSLTEALIQAELASKGQFQGTVEELQKLKKRLEEIRNTEIKIGDKDGLKKVDEALEQVENKLDEVNKGFIDLTKLNGDLKHLTLDELKHAASLLEKEIGKCSENMEEFADHAEALRNVNAQIDRIKSEMKDTENVIVRTAKRLASYVLVYAGFNEVWGRIKEVVSANLELSDSFADIQKTTGLTSESVADLSRNINSIDTRTSQQQLHELAAVAGQIGLKATDDILGFVKASNMITVSLNELGSEGTAALMKLAQLTGDVQELGVEKSLLSIGSAINELSANSAATAGPIVELMNRMGGIASQSNITTAELAAIGATADAIGQSMEITGTSMNKFIATLLSNTDQIAYSLNMDAKALKDLIANGQTMEAMISVFERMKDMGGISALAPVMGDLGSEGARMTQLLSAMAKNVGFLREQVDLSRDAFEEAISIENEYNVKNENAIALLERMGNTLAEMWVNSGFVTGLTWVLKQLNEFVKWLAEGETGARILKTAVIALGTAIVLASAHLDSFVKALFTANTYTGLLTRSWTKFTKALKANWISLLIGLLASLAYYIYEAYTHVTKLTRAISDYNSELDKELSKSDSLFNALNRENLSREEKRKIISQINKQYKDLLGFMVDETDSAEKLAAAWKLVNAELKTRLALSLRDKIADSINEEYADTIKETNANMVKTISSAEGFSELQSKEVIGKIADIVRYNIALPQENLMALIKKELEGYNLKGKSIGSSLFFDLQSDIKDYINAKKEYQTEIEVAERTANADIEKTKQDAIQERINTLNLINKEFEALSKESTEGMSEDELQAHYEKMMDHAQDYLDGSKLLMDKYTAMEKANLLEGDKDKRESEAKRLKAAKESVKAYQEVYLKSMEEIKKAAPNADAWGKEANLKGWKETLDNLKTASLDSLVSTYKELRDAPKLISDVSKYNKMFGTSFTSLSEVMEDTHDKAEQIKNQLASMGRTTTGDFLWGKGGDKDAKRKAKEEFKAAMSALEAYFNERETLIREKGLKEGKTQVQINQELERLQTEKLKDEIQLRKLLLEEYWQESTFDPKKYKGVISGTDYFKDKNMEYLNELRVQLEKWGVAMEDGMKKQLTDRMVKLSEQALKLREKINKILLQDDFNEQVAQQYLDSLQELGLLFGLTESEIAKTSEKEGERRLAYMREWAKESYNLNAQQLQDKIEQETAFSKWRIGRTTEDYEALLIQLRKFHDDEEEADRKAAERRKKIFDNSEQGRKLQEQAKKNVGDKENDKEMWDRFQDLDLVTEDTTDEAQIGIYQAKIDASKAYIEQLKLEMEAEIKRAKNNVLAQQATLQALEMMGIATDEQKGRLKQAEAEVASLMNQMEMMIAGENENILENQQNITDRYTAMQQRKVEEYKKYSDAVVDWSAKMTEAEWDDVESRKEATKEMVKTLLTYLRDWAAAKLTEMAMKAMFSDQSTLIEGQEMSKSMTMQGAKAGASVALSGVEGTGKEVAKHGLKGLLIGAAITAALTALMNVAMKAMFKSKAQVESISGAGGGRLATGMLTYAKGKYPTLGNDGVVYDAQYEGSNIKTGIYRGGAHFGIFSEKKPEAIIDGDTTQRLIMNHPDIWKAIVTLSKNGRLDSGMGMRTFATGNINDLARQAQDMEASATTDNSAQMAQMQATLDRNSQVMAQLMQVLAGGIKASINMYGEDGMYKSMKKAEKYAGRVGYK